jgi:uncharacterized protein (DUF433 family)
VKPRPAPVSTTTPPTRSWRVTNRQRAKVKRPLSEKTMKDQELLERITLDPRVMVGKPVIKGTRLTVDYILNLLGHGATIEEVLEDYSGLTPDDVYACLLFASQK